MTASDCKQMFCTLQLKVLEVEEVDESDTDSGQNNYLLRMKRPNAYYVKIISQYKIYPFRADIVLDLHNYFAMAPAISQLRLACS